MPKDRPPSYTPAPELPSDPELRRRFAEIVNVLAQTQTVAGAARTLNLSRNHFQTILHRVIAAMIEEITPKPAGRPPRPEREVALEAANQKLKADLEALTIRTEMLSRMMSVVGGIASGKTPIPRMRSKKTKPEDPEPAPTLQQAVTTMREAAVPARMCAEALAVSPSTIRRLARPRRACSRSARRPDPTRAQRVRQIVRDSHGLVGAANLGRMSGLPRRMCAEIKSRELREMENERKEQCARVAIAAPHVIRGFDAMHLEATDGPAYWLVAADGSVPYRTSVATVPAYDADHVIEALRADFEINGPPLVLRLDRIACQRTYEVEQLIEHFEVLGLHGPPRYPRYYGQLERQNREHRAWCKLLQPASRAELTAHAERMRTSLNALWPRPSLNGWTAEQAWRTNKPLDINRRELRRDVDQRATGLMRAGVERLRARRIAIESALTERGLLSITQGGWR